MTTNSKIPRWLYNGMEVYVRPSLFGVEAKPGQGLLVKVVRAAGDGGVVEYKGEQAVVSIENMRVKKEDKPS